MISLSFLFLKSIDLKNLVLIKVKPIYTFGLDVN